MKFKFQILFILCFAKISGQTIDSVAIKQVDSLIQISRQLTGKGDFDKAIEINELAGKIAEKQLGVSSVSFGNYTFNYGRIYHFKKNYSESEKWYQKSIEIYEKAIGKVDIKIAVTLNNLGMIYRERGQFAKAEEVLLKAKSIREQIYGKEHVEYLNALGALIGLYKTNGNLDQGEKTCLELNEICKKIMGVENIYYTSNLVDLSIFYRSKGLYSKAEELCLESISIQEKSLGKDNLVYGFTINNLALLYNKMGNYEKAEPLYYEMLYRQEKKTGKLNVDYALGLENLAILYEQMGYFEKSESKILEAKEIFLKILGNEHSRYAVNLYVLADLYNRFGIFDKAESLYLNAKAIIEKTMGKMHPDYSKILNNLANLYFFLHQYSKAEALYLESKEIDEKLYGKENQEFSSALSNLAIVSGSMGNFSKAEALFKEALKELEMKTGTENQNYADCLNNFGSFYIKVDDYEKAAPLIIKSLEIKEKVIGKKHPNYASSLTNLGLIYKELKQPEKAISLYLESKSIVENTLGKVHDNYTNCLEQLSSLYYQKGNYELAESSLLELSRISKLMIERAMHHLSEKELDNYLSEFEKSQNRVLWYAHNTNDRDIIADGYDNSLFYKGFLLNAISQLKRLASKDSQSIQKYQDLQAIGRRLAKEYSSPLAERNLSSIAELEERGNSIEKELAQTIKGFQEVKRQWSFKDIQNILKSDEATIEFVYYVNPDAKNKDSIYYAALILRKDRIIPLFIPLFEQRSLDSLFVSKGGRKADYVNYLYTIENRGASSLETKQNNLFELIWKPIEKDLSGIHTIYYSPTGLLHRINLAAIPISLEENLADRYKLMEMNSTRQLISPIENSITSNKAVLMGGLRYNLDTTQLVEKQILENHSSQEKEMGLLANLQRGGSWSYLAGTDLEVKKIQKLMLNSGLEAIVYSGNNGTEENFKKLGTQNISPKLIHIATHGYFFEDKINENDYFMNSQNDSIVQKSDEANKMQQMESVFKLSNHPLMRSGLILSGGNAGWNSERSPDQGEDGILTAYEISQMNLSNTELVVLSACETGLGDIQGNEGVYGLQRAFKIAGAKYLIMSLWQVPDKQTSLLMTTFYKKWLQEKMNIPDAFHAAQKELRESGLDPYQWAGFVLVE